MKVVINGCYGGFGLSPAAQRRYAELKGIGPLYFYQQTKYEFSDGVAEYKRMEPDTAKRSLCTYALTRDLGATVNKLPNEGWFSYRDIERNDPILVQVVEEMGADANGECAKLEIVEIPDDVEWEIDEYDGNEWVAEKHRRWG